MFFSKLTAAAALAITAVSAQINTPAALFQCQPIQISWQPTTGPYYLSVIPGGQPSAAPLINFGEVQNSPITWNVNITAGTSVGFALVDSTGTPKYSDALTIRPGSSDSCLSTSSGGAGGNGSSGGAGGNGSSGGAGGDGSSASSGAGAATSSAASAVSSASASGASRVASATSAAGSMAASASARASGASGSAGAATTTSANGASKVESAGLMAAALAVVVAAAI